MLEKIKSEILKKYKATDIKGMFFSVFSNTWDLLMSNGVADTDKTITELCEIIYNWLIQKQKNIQTIAVDIVEDFQKQDDVNKILTLDPQTFGIFIINRETKKSWLILPGTSWVKDMRSALTFIKKKFEIEWSVEIYSFKTNRVIVEN